MQSNNKKVYNCVVHHQVLLGLTKEMVEVAAFTLDKAISLVSDNVRSVTQFYKVLAYQLQ